MLLSIHVFNIRSCSLEVDISVQIDIVPRLFRLRGDNIGAGERDLVRIYILSNRDPSDI